MPPRVYIQNLGCPKNEVDGALIKSYLAQNGCVFTDSPNRADLLIVNTCGFIEDAKEESVNAIFDAVQIKQSGRPKKLIVAGCLAQRYKEQLSSEIPEIDHFLGIQDLKNVLKVIKSMANSDTYTGAVKREYISRDVLPYESGKSYAYLKISDGCDNHCSYCAIPSIRGRFRSRKMADIVREAEAIIHAGCRELIIIAQDSTRYGIDLYGKPRLPQLIERLDRLPGRFGIRLMYTHPAHYTDEIVETIAGPAKVLPYLDIPLQHASNRVLKAMNRKTTSRAIKDLIHSLRKRIDGLTIRTSYLVGFPGETSSDFELLLRFQDEFDIERVGVFGFSEEEGTAAFGRARGVRPETIAKRIDEMMTLVMGQSLDRNSSMIGDRLHALVDGPASTGHVWARLDSQAPEIDGCILVEGNHRRGSRISVELTSCDAYDFRAVSLGRVRA